MKLNKIIGSIVLAGWVGAAGGLEAATYTLDKAHSQVGFSVKHMVISNVKGEFTDYGGTFETDDEDNLKDAMIEIDAKSIFTREAKRDKHLSSPDFLDVEKFPKLTFKYKNTVSRDGNQYKVAGDLTIHGVTKEVVLEMELLGKATDPYGNFRLGFTGTTAINRKDFGLVWNKVLETGGLVVGETVKITIEGEGIRNKENASAETAKTEEHKH